MTRIIVFGAAVLAAPLVGLIAFGAPESDDFCFLAVYNGHGLFGGIIETWTLWNGRLSASALILTPYAFSNDAEVIHAVYRILLLAIFALWLTSAYAAVRFWIADRGRRFVMFAIFVAAFMVWAPNFREQAIWLPPAATYVLPTIGLTYLFLFLFAPLAQRIEDRTQALRPSRVIAWIGACAATAVAAFANEFSGFAAALFVAASSAARREHAMPSEPVGHAAVLAIAVAGLAVMVTAPGVIDRLDYYEHSRSIARTMALAPLNTAEFALRHLFSPGHIAWYGAFAVVVSQAPKLDDEHGARRAAFYILAATVVSIGVAFAIGQFGLGRVLPGRAQNQLHLVTAITLSTALAFYMRSGAHAAAFETVRRWTARAPHAAGIFIVILLAANPNSEAAYKTILNGDADRFWDEARAFRQAFRGRSGL